MQHACLHAIVLCREFGVEYVGPEQCSKTDAVEPEQHPQVKGVQRAVGEILNPKMIDPPCMYLRALMRVGQQKQSRRTRIVPSE